MIQLNKTTFFALKYWYYKIQRHLNPRSDSLVIIITHFITSDIFKNDNFQTSKLSRKNLIRTIFLLIQTKCEKENKKKHKKRLKKMGEGERKKNYFFYYLLFVKAKISNAGGINEFN